MNQLLQNHLELIADLSAVLGENKFKVQAFQSAAYKLRSMKELSLEEIALLPGFGPSIMKVVIDFHDTGTSERLETLKSQVPSPIIELMKVPGIGPRKAHRLYFDLQVDSIAELQRLVAIGQITDSTIIAGVQAIASTERKPFEAVCKAVAPLYERLVDFTYTDVAGSLRRGCETVKDADILCRVESFDWQLKEAIRKEFFRFGDKSIEGDSKCRIFMKTYGFVLQVDLLFVDLIEWGSALLYFTGSKDFNIKMRARAKELGFLLNEHGLFEGDKRICSSTEESIFQAIGWEWTPPMKRI